MISLFNDYCCKCWLKHREELQSNENVMTISEVTNEVYGDEMKLADIKRSLGFSLYYEGSILDDDNPLTSETLESRSGGGLLFITRFHWCTKIINFVCNSTAETKCFTMFIGVLQHLRNGFLTRFLSI